MQRGGNKKAEQYFRARGADPCDDDLEEKYLSEVAVQLRDAIEKSLPPFTAGGGGSAKESSRGARYEADTVSER